MVYVSMSQVKFACNDKASLIVSYVYSLCAVINPQDAVIGSGEVF